MKNLSLILLSFCFINSISAQQVKLVRDDGAADEYFGNDVAIHNNYAIVSSYFDDDNGWGAGSVYIFKKEGDIWAQKQKLKPSGIDAYDFFGTSVAIEGDIAVVGATGDDQAGTVYVFRRNGEEWKIEQILKPSIGLQGDQFGCSVDIENNIITVGAVGDNFFSGSVYIFGKNGAVWEEKQNITPLGGMPYEYYGCSVSMDNGVLAIGARAYQVYGGVFIYLKDGNTWENVAKIKDDNGGQGDQFGGNVSVNGDFIAVGARLNDAVKMDCGAVYIFERNVNSWNLQKKITPADGIENEKFGRVSLEGDILAIGAENDDVMGLESGSIYLYTKEGNDWKFSKKLTANDGFAGDGLGSCVSLNNNLLIAGAPYDNDGGSDAGSAYVFDLNEPNVIEGDEDIPKEFSLFQNYPNPFNPSTNIKFSIPKGGNIKLKVYNILGKEIAVLLDEHKTAGNYEVKVSLGNISSGIYFYRLESNNFTETKKMVLLR